MAKNGQITANDVCEYYRIEATEPFFKNNAWTEEIADGLKVPGLRTEI